MAAAAAQLAVAWVAVAAAAAASAAAAAAAAAAVGEAQILAAEMAAHVASASGIFGTLRHDDSQMAVGTAGGTLRSWKDNLAVFSYLTAEPSSGRWAVHVHVIHGGLDLLGVAWMTSWAGHRWSGGRRMNVAHNLHGACDLWKKSDVGGDSHHDATSLHLGAHHNRDRCV